LLKSNLKEVALTFYFGGNENPESRKVLNSVEKETKNVLNTQLDFKWIPWEEIENKINTLFLSGDNFDAFASIYDGDYNMQFYKMAQEGFLLNISELFPKYAIDLYKKYSKEELRQVTYQGKILGVPARMPTSYRMCAIVRKDLVNEYGISPIRTIKDYDNFLRTVNKNEQNVLSLTWPPNTLYLFADLYGYVHIGNGIVYKRDDFLMKLIPWEQTSEYKEAVYMLKEWEKAGYINNSLPVESALKADNFGSLLAPFAVLSYFVHTIPNIKNELEYYPLNENEFSSIVNNNNSLLVLNKNAGNPERTLAFLNWVQSKQENYDLFMYGIKDMHYTLKGRDLVLTAGKELYCGWSGSSVFQNIEYDRQYATDPPNYLKTYRDVMLKNTSYPLSSGFMPDTREFDDAVRLRSDDCQKIEELIRLGNFESSDIDEFILKQKNAGIENIIDMLQKQLNKWEKDNK
jgi:putative aldouronate transport system substrate-binding protein